MKPSLSLSWLIQHRRRAQSHDDGFTLLEGLVVVIMVGILAAIAAPGWLGYLSRRRVVSIRDDVYQALLQAQAEARQKSVAHKLSFRTSPEPDTLGFLEWSVHPSSVAAPTNWETAQTGSVEIDTACAGAPDPLGGGTFEFDYKGNVTTNSISTVYLSSSVGNTVGDADPTLRAVHLQTLIGAIRKVDKTCIP